MRLSALLSTLALLLLPGALAAQANTASRPVGCRGTSTQTSSITLTTTAGQQVDFPDYPVIESVTPGSPAEVAGFRFGDRVILQDGRDLIADPPTQPRMAGDTVVFVVRRNDVEIPLTVVMGYWDPPQEAPGVTRVCRRLEASPGRE